MKRTIAIIEDQPELRENYRDAFERHGYRVLLYSNRPDALQGMESDLPDLAIIDIQLGDEVEGGFDLCNALRNRSATLPIIFLTARDSELDIISGLRLGADDYLTKDISLPHLLARVVALFRRLDAVNREQPSEDQQQLVETGNLTLDLDRLTAHWGRQPLDTTLTEFWILHSLAQRPGHVKSRQQLMDAANVVLDEQTITSHIKRIRKKIQALDPNFDAIQTVYGAGYRWML